MFKVNIWRKVHNEKAYIYEEAAAQFSETLLFMALHDEFGFGMKRMEKIVKYWDDLPGDEDHIRSWLQIITEHGYNNEKMDRYYARKILPLASAGLLKRDKIGKDVQRKDTQYNSGRGCHHVLYPPDVLPI